jgi:hypothetical protein
MVLLEVGRMMQQWRSFVQNLHLLALYSVQKLFAYLIPSDFRSVALLHN